MPTIAIVDGIRIVIFFNDHAPPHFHAFLGAPRFRIDISTGRSMEARGGTVAGRMLGDGALTNRDALLKAWAAAQDGLTPGRIG